MIDENAEEISGGALSKAADPDGYEAHLLDWIIESYKAQEKSLEECVDKLKQASRNYAKRQLTWFNRMKEINWLFIDKEDYKTKARIITERFLGN